MMNAAHQNRLVIAIGYIALCVPLAFASETHAVATPVWVSGATLPAASINNLGCLAMQNGKFSEAENLFRQALRILEQAQLTETPTGLGIAANLGVVLHKEGRSSAAHDIYERVAEVANSIDAKTRSRVRCFNGRLWTA